MIRSLWVRNTVLKLIYVNGVTTALDLGNLASSIMGDIFDDDEVKRALKSLAGDELIYVDRLGGWELKGGGVMIARLLPDLPAEGAEVAAYTRTLETERVPRGGDLEAEKKRADAAEAEVRRLVGQVSDIREELSEWRASYFELARAEGYGL